MLASNLWHKRKDGFWPTWIVFLRTDFVGEPNMFLGLCWYLLWESLTVMLSYFSNSNFELTCDYRGPSRSRCLNGERSTDLASSLTAPNDGLGESCSESMIWSKELPGCFDLSPDGNSFLTLLVGDFILKDESWLLSTPSYSSMLDSRLRFTLSGRRVKWSRFSEAFTISLVSILYGPFYYLFLIVFGPQWTSDYGLRLFAILG